MKYTVKVSERVFRIGANDRRTHLFENLWPLPQGVAYNSYLIRDEKTVLLDTIESSSAQDFLNTLTDILRGKTLDYIIINHMELDHASQIGEVIKLFPEVKIIGNKFTAKVLGSYFPEAMANFMEIKDGDTLDLGHHKLQFYLTPMLHWPETMMSYDTTEGILFSGDAFGTFGAIRGGVLDKNTKLEFFEDEMRRYYSNIVGKFSAMAQKAIARLKSTIEIKTICSLHGPIWQKYVGDVISLYDKWSRYESESGVVICYGSMYGNTASMADYIAHRIAEQGVQDIVIHDVSKTHMSYIVSDIWKYKGVMLGSVAYNGDMFPAMANLCHELTHLGIKDKKLGLFGSYSWNGGGVRNLKKFADELAWEQVCEPCEIHGRTSKEKYAICDSMALAMAEAVKK
ncbi:MAG: FprA family A-type flavoprotein [Rikenellaceae bacterium]